MARRWAFALLCYQICAVIGQSYPSCADACILAAVPSACNSTDNVCICQQVDQASLLSCLASSCSCTDQQSAAATFDSTCASNGVQLALNVACATASASSVSTSASSSVAATTSDLSSSTVPTSSTDAASSAAPSSTYSAPAPAPTTITTSVQVSTVEMVSSVPGGLSTSTAVVVFMSSESTVLTFVTSTHWYTPTPASTSSSISSYSSSTSSSSPTIVSVTQGSLIHHGLATGVKAGIGAGVGAAVIAATVFGFGLFWVCRRRRRKTSSVAGSQHYDPSIVPDDLVVAPVQEKRLADLKRLSELPSESASRKPTYSWGNPSLTESSHHRSPSSEEDGFHHSISVESGQRSPPIDLAAYQRPIFGHDGYWRNAQELQGGAPNPDPAATSAPANFPQPPYLHKVQSRPIVPPGKWPPNSYDRSS